MENVIFLSYDWLMINPIPGLDPSTTILKHNRLLKAPVVRVFGHRQETGESCCLLLHGFFPSLLCQVPPNIEPLLTMLGTARSATGEPVVYELRVEKKTDIYGYHETASDLLRVYCVNPIEVARLASLIQEKFPQLRVYEVHIPYLLQFLIAHDIQGVSPIMLDPTMVVSVPDRLTNSKIEIHAHVRAIRNGQLKEITQSQPLGYVKPKPLVRGTSENSLVCGSCLDTVWDEEAKRYPDKPFPYIPEGIEDGKNRPVASDIPHVIDRVARLRSLCAESEVTLTQMLLENIASAPFNLSQQPTLQQSTNPDAFEYPPTECDDTEPPSTIVSREQSPVKPSTSQVLPTQRSVVTCHSSDWDLTALDHACSDMSSVWPESKGQLVVFAPPPKCNATLKATLPSQRWSLSGSLAESQLIKDLLPIGKNRKDATYGTLLELELIVDKPGGEVNVDPDRDGLLACIAILRDQYNNETDRVIALACNNSLEALCLADVDEMIEVADESALLVVIHTRLFRDFDPAVVLSWDAQKHVIDYLYCRAKYNKVIYCFNLSRVTDFDHDKDASGLPGRIVLDLWKLLRSGDSGLNLGTTSLAGCVLELLGLTIPSIPMSTLASWMKQRYQNIVALRYAVSQAKHVLGLLDSTCLLDRAVEMARIYGCDVTSVFTRGSQFKVECMLTRAAKRTDFVLVSSSKDQVRNQTAPQGIPLVLEPKSGYYTDPVCVLDFQSLYPSIVIAYNMCYSTCLGFMTDSANQSFGTQQHYMRDIAKAMKQPGGVIGVPGDAMFVGRETRVGILPRMLHEVLQTRFMVKKAMKRCGQDRASARKLDARQLTLKLLANVTYGYTGASFSGRMPCAELADAIVLTARSTLEAAIATAEDMGGEVLYGDTDSLFVLYRGSSLSEAFTRGQKLADAVTAMNPWPMKLQMEKVYWPCCLVSKKRYVGRAFDSPNSTEPRFDAKGIETVRRDNCPLTGKTLTKILKSLFEQPNSSNPQLVLKQSIIHEVGKILRGDGTSNIRDFIFQNQVRTGYKDPEHLPPAARVASNMNLDISRGQRIAYVVVHRGPEASLCDKVVPPAEVVSGASMLDCGYYIFKNIVPALQRTLGISFASAIPRWVRELPLRKIAVTTAGSLDAFVSRNRCRRCDGRATVPESAPVFCAHCMNTYSSNCRLQLANAVQLAESRMSCLRKICLSCAGSPQAAEGCEDAWHCSVYFEREKVGNSLKCARDDYLSVDW